MSDSTFGRLLLTGGTGFVGRSILDRFAVENLRLGFSLTVLTRDPERFIRSGGRRESSWLRFVQGDVRSLPSRLGKFDGIIHAATPNAAVEAELDEMLETIVSGTRNILQLAATCGDIPVLLTSSGAVYGRQPDHLTQMSEAYLGAPDPLEIGNAYAEGKRLAELRCALWARSSRVRPKIARMFAFVGPHLPLDRHFAIGNFIGDVIAGRAINVAGDGTAVRSYLYADDMVDWLWAIFARGEPMRPYNVGSERSIDIASLARMVANAGGRDTQVLIHGTGASGGARHRYVPETTRIRSELNVAETIDLEAAIGRTIGFHRDRVAR